jgi:hypothetical protein
MIGNPNSARRAALLASAAILALSLSACQATDANRPTIWPVAGGPTSLPTQAEAGDGSNILLVTGEAPATWQVTPLATVDSIAGREGEPGLLARQQADLRRKAARVGATAIIQIRTESLRTRGFERDPNTPFPAWRLGDGRSQFLRGMAVRHSGSGSPTVTGPVSPVSPAPTVRVEASGFIGGLGNLGN